MRLATEPSQSGDGLLFIRGGLVLCLLVILFSSLVPFTGWRVPDEFAWSSVARRHQTLFDLALNILVYFAPGFLLARLGVRKGSTRPALMATLVCAALSLCMESLQLFLPGRVSALHDWFANSAGAFFGALLAVTLAGERVALRVLGWRQRWLHAGAHAEIGAVLLLIWLIAQTNPGVAYFEAGNIVNRLTIDWQSDPYDPLFLIPQVVAIGLNVCGFALFLSIFISTRSFAGVPVTLILATGLLIKFLAAGLMLKAPLLSTWLGPTSVLGLLAGYFMALLLLGAKERTRLFLALILVFAGGLMSKMAAIYDGSKAMLGVFDWPHGQIGAFASLTRWLNELWPFAALIYLAWLYVSTGRQEIAAQVNDGLPADAAPFFEVRIMSFYQHHVFFCTNKRENGERCCQDNDAQAMRDYAKQRCKELKLNGPGKVRINNAGCLDRCDEGPVIVVYPEETWYTYVDKHDIDEIVEEHLVNGRVVERLKI